MQKLMCTCELKHMCACAHEFYDTKSQGHASCFLLWKEANKWFQISWFYHSVLWPSSSCMWCVCFSKLQYFLMMINHDNVFLNRCFLFNYHISVPTIPIRVQVGMFWSISGLTTDHLSCKHTYMRTCIHANVLAYAHAFTSIHMYMHASAHGFAFLLSPGTSFA